VTGLPYESVTCFLHRLERTYLVTVNTLNRRRGVFARRGARSEGNRGVTDRLILSDAERLTTRLH
jgi:hypothetical protein